MKSTISQSDTAPTPIEVIGDKKYARFDVQEVVGEGDGETTTSYKYREMVFHSSMEDSFVGREVKKERIAMAKDKLASLDWIWSKFERDVTVLGVLSKEDFAEKYAAEIATQRESVLLIRELEET